MTLRKREIIGIEADLKKILRVTGKKIVSLKINEEYVLYSLSAIVVTLLPKKSNLK